MATSAGVEFTQERGTLQGEKAGADVVDDGDRIAAHAVVRRAEDVVVEDLQPCLRALLVPRHRAGLGPGATLARQRQWPDCADEVAYPFRQACERAQGVPIETFRF